MEMTHEARRVWISAAVLAATTTAAAAESYCVACYGPDAVYSCVIADVPASAAPDPRNQVQCIKQLAKSGGHSRCSVERFSTANCNGVEKVVSTAAGVPIAGPAPEQESTPPPASKSADDIADKTSEPEPVPAQTPRTVEELAKSAAATTTESLNEVGGTVKSTTEKAGNTISGMGSAVGNAAKKSWNCLTSLFNDC